jgi:hypothetical protein
MLLTYYLNCFEMVPVAPIITGITLVFTFHMRCISIVKKKLHGLVREQTIPTERPPPVGEVSANFCG